jgi:hypothetical protein
MQEPNGNLVERVENLIEHGATEFGNHRLASLVRDNWPTIRAALSPPTPQEGWKMVPVEMTYEMSEAAMATMGSDDDRHVATVVSDVYRAAVAASPPPNAGALDPATLEAAAKVAEEMTRSIRPFVSSQGDELMPCRIAARIRALAQT